MSDEKGAVQRDIGRLEGKMDAMMQAVRDGFEATHNRLDERKRETAELKEYVDEKDGAALKRVQSLEETRAVSKGYLLGAGALGGFLGWLLNIFNAGGKHP